MSLSVTIREATTDYIDFQLLFNKVGINLSAIDHLTMTLEDSVGASVTYSTDDSSPKLFITDDGVDGKVQFRPAVTDLVYSKQPYKGFFWVYVTSIRKYSVPENTEFEVEIHKL